MTLKQLRNYRAICAEITQRERQLEKDRVHVVDTVQTAAEFPYWKHTVSVEGDVYPYDARPVQGLILRRKTEKAEIERYVENINNYIVRRAVEVRYIEPQDEKLTWDRIAEMIGYHGSGHALQQLVWLTVKKKS